MIVALGIIVGITGTGKGATAGQNQISAAISVYNFIDGVRSAIAGGSTAAGGNTDGVACTAGQCRIRRKQITVVTAAASVSAVGQIVRLPERIAVVWTTSRKSTCANSTW